MLESDLYKKNKQKRGQVDLSRDGRDRHRKEMIRSSETSQKPLVHFAHSQI